MDVDVMDYTIVRPENVKKHWPLVRVGLEEIVERFPQRWIPEDVYAQLSFNNAELVLLKKHDRSIGFFIGVPTTTIFLKERQYFVWAIWRARGATVTRADRDWTISLLKRRARNFDCTEITYGSARRGFEFYGAKMDFVFYRIDV